MINSFCIETPVPVSGSAQGHLETARPKADVAYCHGKLLCPEELMLYSTTGEKYVVLVRNYRSHISPLQGWCEASGWVSPAQNIPPHRPPRLRLRRISLLCEANLHQA